MKITIKDVESVLGFELSPETKKEFKTYDFNYTPLKDVEYNQYVIDVINLLMKPIVYSGSHRIADWEAGWGANLANFAESGKVEDLVPKYHSKNPYARWAGLVVKPSSSSFDYNIHTIFVDSILKHYLKDVDNVFEFGCGPGYHLLRISKFFKDKKLTGLDWAIASQNTIKKINEKFGTNIAGHNFNFFELDHNLEIPQNSGIYTVAALEQVGENFKDFVNFLIEKKPSVCVHMEPIDELLDPSRLTDVLSIQYFRKRNYLKGFLPYLEQLESEGKIEILAKQRIYVGSHYIEGHSLVVWKPL